jgi:prevent-host-death family protein
LTITVLPLGDVKSRLSELVGRVHDHHECVTVTVHGRPWVILIAPEDLEALEETLEIMCDAATMNRLAEFGAELARGEYVPAEDLAEAMRQRQAQRGEAAEEPYELRTISTARRALSETLPEAVAA